ncbi:hypothetical protein [Nocardioides szechwanensis]|uniref:hypothetical protein n=1 Tax=Nocardioides szechwanensis TaxID=1005944 RepID=UPI000B86B662|nr:hypothetical protein [Nocardioides szechwanensis]
MTARRRPLTRRDVDVRLGYTGLGVGAVVFVLVLVTSYVVIEVAPRIGLPGARDARAQSVVRYPALEAVPTVDRGGRSAGGGVATRARPGIATQEAGTTSPAIDEAGGSAEDGGWGSAGTGSTSDGPGTAVVEGQVSQAVDPVVDGLAASLDAATGGASGAVTGPAGGVVDDATDLGDALLPRP